MDTLKANGYSITDACQGVGISRSWYYVSKKPKDMLIKAKDSAELVDKIKSIKTEHPFWGVQASVAIPKA